MNITESLELLSYEFPRSFQDGKDVENNSGQECIKSGMLPVTDKDLASMLESNCVYNTLLYVLILPWLVVPLYMSMY